MNYKYFTINEQTTAQDVKKQYHDLIKKYHPDLENGSEQAMKTINAEFEAIMQKGIEATKDSKDEQLKRSYTDFKQYADILNKIIFIQDINIEIIGSWVWLSGQTYLHTDDIKKAGFKYSGNKKAWYWYNNIDVKKYFKGRYSLNQIRSKHGSILIENEKRELLTANK